MSYLKPSLAPVNVDSAAASCCWGTVTGGPGNGFCRVPSPQPVLDAAGTILASL